MAGERQPAAVHAAVCALNTSLGNTGKTVSYYETKDAALPSVSSLASLVSAMKGGAVQTLVVLGGNPVFDAPADLDFASAMAKVPHSIALGHTVDETSSKAEWHVPRAHYLESWGDARAVGGTLSVVQPLILPLFGGRTAVEVLGLMVGGKDRPGYDIVRETWKPILGEAEFDSKWNRVLHDGFLSGSELPEVVPDSTAQPLAELARPMRRRRSPGGLEIVFLPSPSLHDGRFANDGWLQELPDPLTKLTWDNPALVSPKTAETLGLANGDVVRLDHAGRSLELPVWTLPGMADGVVALTLGYGRLRAGRIGSGVGFDTFTVRASQAPGFDSGVKLTRLGRTYPLSATQEHGSMEGRPVVRESTLAELQSKPAAEAEQAEAGRPRPSGRSPRRARRLRRRPGALLPLEGACLRSGAPVGDDDRLERLHRLQRVHDGVPEREQRARRRQDPGRERARDALDPGRPVLLRRARPPARRWSSSPFPACTARMPPASRSAPWQPPSTTRRAST